MSLSNRILKLDGGCSLVLYIQYMKFVYALPQKLRAYHNVKPEIFTITVSTVFFLLLSSAQIQRMSVGLI